ncbi:MAG TPA: SDR family oxidoreductase [Acidimicrobiales bacterium]|nr:SDR family oxidoreductase [Acidimicrobiales bacterium]
MSRTVVVTGSASGMGAATARRLVATGHRVIGVDLHDATVIADLGTRAGRASAIAEVAGLVGGPSGSLDGVVTWAGLAGLTDRPGSLLASVNYFGTVELLDGLRPLLARGDRPAAVAISSNATVIQPNVPDAVTEACLSGDEDEARTIADEVGSLNAYPATKTAVARWVRRHAPGAAWAGAGITLNAVAPGAVETPLLQESRQDRTVGEFVDALPIPAGRKGTAEELAGFVEFLLGPDARWFCGSFLLVDGGTDASLRPDDTPANWVP